MREPNLCFPSQNRAVVCISSALYDRRALDCTATLPLVNSLTHLVYLTSTTPRIREILCLDGGLERLIRILQQTSSKADRLTLWKWTLAFQNIVNIGVRGTEQIRTKVVDAGVIPFVLTILGNYEKSYELVNGKKELRRGKNKSMKSISLLITDFFRHYCSEYNYFFRFIKRIIRFVIGPKCSVSPVLCVCVCVFLKEKKFSYFFSHHFRSDIFNIIYEPFK